MQTGRVRFLIIVAAGAMILAWSGWGLAQNQPAEPKPETERPTAEMTAPAAEESVPPGEFAAPGACADCHEEIANALKKTTHGRTSAKTWDGASSCESCHGPGAAHIAAGGDKTKIRIVRALPPAEASAVCLTCHERDDRSHWQGSQHEGRGLSCLSCHKIHHEGAPPAKLLAL